MSSRNSEEEQSCRDQLTALVTQMKMMSACLTLIHSMTSLLYLTVDTLSTSSAQKIILLNRIRQTKISIKESETSPSSSLQISLKNSNAQLVSLKNSKSISKQYLQKQSPEAQAQIVRPRNQGRTVHIQAILAMQKSSLVSHRGEYIQTRKETTENCPGKDSAMHQSRESNVVSKNRSLTFSETHSTQKE